MKSYVLFFLSPHVVFQLIGLIKQLNKLTELDHVGVVWAMGNLTIRRRNNELLKHKFARFKEKRRQRDDIRR